MKTRLTDFSPRTIAFVGAVFLAGLCAVCSTMFLRLEEHRTESRRWVQHTYQVLTEINNLSGKLKDVELGQRGYLLTGQDQFLAPYKAARGMELSPDDAVSLGTVDARSVEQILFNLTTLTEDNPVQRADLAHLESLVEAKLEEVEHVLDLWHSQGSHMAIRVLTTADSQHTIAAIQVTMSQMINREKILLAEREQSDNRADRLFTTFAGYTGLAMFLCLAVTFLLMWRSFSRMREAEQELLVQERQFRLVLDGGADAFFLFRAEPQAGGAARFAPVHLNSHAVAMVADLALDRANFSAYRLRQCFKNHADREATDQELVVRRKFQQSEASPITGLLADRHFQEQIIPVPDGVAITYRDITEQKQVVKMKNEFISTVSHELRTPLTSIRGSLGLLAAGTVGELPGAALNLIKIAHNNCERLVRLINDILDIDKLEAGKMRMSLRPVSLMATLRASLEANAGYAERFGVRLMLQVPDDAAPEQIYVKADTDRLLQILANLLSNAIKFSTAESEVSVAFRAAGELAYIEVRDHGRGISEEFRKRIFGKFTQADAADTRDKGGTGLGLSIVKAMVETMGGTVGFTSELGQGSIFYFSLPLAEPPPAPAAVIAEPRCVAGPRILVCEDEPDAATLLAMILQRDGFEVDIAHTAEKAVALLRQRDYLGMTLDLLLPDISGVRLIRDLRADPKFRDLPIIVVSARADAGRRELNGDAIGILDWLMKPVEPDRISQLARRFRGTGTIGHVLHVEDDEDIIRFLEVSLGDSVKVTRAQSLSEAKRWVSTRSFDLVILDIGLPDGSGIDLLPMLGIGGRRIPVVLYTANEVPEEISAQVVDALVKSRTSEEALTATVRRLLGTQSELPAVAEALS